MNFTIQMRENSAKYQGLDKRKKNQDKNMSLKSKISQEYSDSFLQNEVSQQRMIDEDEMYQNPKAIVSENYGLENRTTKGFSKRLNSAVNGINQFNNIEDRLSEVKLPFSPEPSQKSKNSNEQQQMNIQSANLTNNQNGKANISVIPSRRQQRPSNIQQNDIFHSLVEIRGFYDTEMNQIFRENDQKLGKVSTMKIIQQKYEQAVKLSKQSEDAESSENYFEALKRDNKEESEQSSNIFEICKNEAQINKLNKVEQDSDSDSDEGNIFESAANKRQQQKLNIMKSSEGENNYSIQKILCASIIYKASYLQITQRRYIKKMSLDIPQLRENDFQTNKIPKQYFFKPDRLQFKKIIDLNINETSNNTYFYLCKANNDRTNFYFQDLKSEQLNNLNGSKCPKLSFEKPFQISPHIEYDHINQRFYLFSNEQQHILVYSQKSLEQLCRVPVKKKVLDPNLYFYHINNRTFLMLIGGYVRVEKRVAEGNKFIEIFEIEKWHVSLKSKCIKLIIGRICPIVLPIKEKNIAKLMILGGNSIAKITREGVLDFNYENDINQSTNMTGICISSHEISELFDYQEQVTVSNLSVKIPDPYCLHSGVVITFNQTFLLILPKSNNLFQVKIFSKQINIIEARTYVFLMFMQQYQRRELTLKVDRDKLIIYRIDQRGILNISTQEGKKAERCCNIY